MANKMKWNESGFRPHLCTYRLNWARRTSWGWWVEWDDTVLQTQYSKFEPWWSRPSTLPLGHGGSPHYWLAHVDGEKNIFVSFKPPRPGTEPRTLAWKAAVLTTTPEPPPYSMANHHICYKALKSYKLNQLLHDKPPYLLQSTKVV